MPSNTVTCPFCNSTLKSKTPVPGGTRIKCPKCSTQFVVKPDDAEDVPPTVAAAYRRLPRPSAAVVPKPAAAAKPAAPKPASAAQAGWQPAPPAAVTPKPAAPKPAAARKPAVLPKPAAKKPAEDEELVEVAEDDVIEITDEEAVEIVDDEAVEITEPLDDEEPLEEIDDDGPPRRRRQRGAKASGIKGIPLWVWLTGGGVLAVVVLGGLVVAGVLLFSILGGPAITQENYDKIKVGALEQEVTAVLGQPNSSPEELAKMQGMAAPPMTLGNAKVLIWKKGDDFIYVVLLQGKVFGKSAKIGTTLLLN